jgi:hypothetical protein
MRIGSSMVDIPNSGGYRMPQSFLGGLGDDTTFSATDLTTIGTAALSIWDQQQLFQENLRRTSQGLAPINISTIGVPQPTVNVGLTQDTQSLVMLGVVGLLGIVLIGKRAK